MRIDFVSDVACPWCAVGLNSLELALQRLGEDWPVELHFQPFELNPQMGPEGEPVADHLRAKYGLTDAQLAQGQAGLAERGAAVGFTFDFQRRTQVWNTFDAHRLLHWAGEVDAEAADGGGRQRRLKHALLQAYQGEGRNPSDPDVLLDVVASCDLDTETARAVLVEGRYTHQVRAAEEAWQRAGIRSVPAIVINRRHLISGGQPPEVFEQALRDIAAAADADSTAR